jgi:uncharacterized DUF497 family protein
MATMEPFEYDEEKNKKNIQKHGIDFEEAATVFWDPLLQIQSDQGNYTEERFIAIGRSSSSRELFVVHCYRANGKK